MNAQNKLNFYKVTYICIVFTVYADSVVIQKSVQY